MKLILAIIQPTKLQTLRDALKEVGIERMSVCDGQGFGRQRGQTETFRGHEYQLKFIRKICIEVAVNDDYLERALDVISKAAKTGAAGNIGDGKVFVLPIDDAVRIGETVRGPEAL